MTKVDYINELQRRIAGLPAKDRAEILADYEEHFEVGRANGKQDQDISKSLGSPKSVAQSILMNTLVTEATTSTNMADRAGALLRILMLFLILAPFNFFMLICPFLVLVTTNIVGWVLPFTLVAATVGLIVGVFTAGLADIGVWHTLSLSSAAIGSLGLAVILGMLMTMFTRGTLWLLVSYVKWNVRFINSRNI